MNGKILLIDGNSIINRAYYAIPLLTNPSGEYTNGVYGFLNIFFKFLDEENPDYVAVAFDLKAPTFRHKAYVQYKGGRKKMPEELRPQIPLLKETLDAMGLKRFETEGYEADDIIGTLSRISDENGLTTVIISGDRDLLQLATDKIKVRIPKTKGGKTEVEDYFAADVLAKYGVTPAEFIEMKALMGDSSDNVPGVTGIGEKTASKIIAEFKTVENVIANYQSVKGKKTSDNIRACEEQLRLSRFLVEIVKDAPIEVNFDDLKCDDMFNEESFAIFKRLNFKKMLDRFDSGIIETHTETKEYPLIRTKEELKKRLPLCDKAAYSVFYDDGRAVGCGLCDKNEAFGVLFGEGLELGDLKDFFEDEKIRKIGSYIKTDARYFETVGVEIKNLIFDIALAAYVINPTEKSYDYAKIAMKFLEKQYPDEEDIMGKGKSKKAFAALADSEKMILTAAAAQTYYNAYDILNDIIEKNNQRYLYYDIEFPLSFVLADMEKQGVKVDKDELTQYGEKVQYDIDCVSAEIYSLAGEFFNINSPKQLGEILFDKLGLTKGKKNARGYSTDAETLEKLKGEHPIVEKILLYRQLAKLKSTYVDGLLPLLDENGKIHSTFKQTITATGRISSAEPNLQNIPIRLERGRELRKAFIPSNDDYLFVDADYSQIELRVLAHIANDETLINAFIKGWDIHRLTASQVFNTPFDEVTSRQRSDAKAVNFGIVYGISAFSLGQDLNISRAQAEAYISGYFEKYPGIKRYLDKSIADAKEKGVASTIYNRIRPMPELKSKNFNLRSFGERVAMNMPIQGSAADIIKLAMIRVYNALKNGGYKSKLILQVHDELLIEAKKDELEEVKNILKKEMEDACELKAKLLVDVHSGKNWLEAK